MGVKINTRGDAAPKPLFEAVDPKTASEKIEAGLKDAVAFAKGDTSKGKVTEVSSTTPLPLAFHMEGSPPTPGWNPMSTVPEDRPILVCVTMPGVGDKWAYYEVMWFTAPGWSKPGWMVVGTQWIRLHDAMPKGWHEAIGHP